MNAQGTASREHVEYHKDGSVWANGKMRQGAPDGYWEWFRKDGTRLRSGHFRYGKQTGPWTTYDKKGEVYKVTDLTPGPKRAQKMRGAARRPAAGRARAEAGKSARRGEWKD